MKYRITIADNINKRYLYEVVVENFELALIKAKMILQEKRDEEWNGEFRIFSITETRLTNF